MEYSSSKLGNLMSQFHLMLDTLNSLHYFQVIVNLPCYDSKHNIIYAVFKHYSRYLKYLHSNYSFNTIKPVQYRTSINTSFIPRKIDIFSPVEFQDVYQVKGVHTFYLQSNSFAFSHIYRKGKTQCTVMSISW